MSKNLIKILCICALVILLPLTVVGVALCVTEPVLCKLSIEESGRNGIYGASSSIAIRVEGKDVEGTEIEVQKHSEITVVFTGTGYDFDGWYNGKADEIKDGDKAVAEETSYKFLIRGNTSLTAVRNVIEYQVKYTGFLDDETTPVSSQISETEQTVEYGQTLESLESVAGATWEGWYVVADQGESVDASGTKVANFSEKEVELKPAWSNQMTIKYMKGETLIATQRVSEEAAPSHTLLDASADVVKTAVSLGKKFAGWKNQAGDTVTSVLYDINGYVLYLQEEEINYTLKVKDNLPSESVVEVSYNVKDGFGSTLKETRDGYTLVGFDFNGTTYTKENLAKEIIKQNNTTIDITTVWQCEYDVMAFEMVAYYDSGDGTEALKGTKGDETDAWVETGSYITYFNAVAGNAISHDLNEDAYATFIGSYSDIHLDNGDEATFNGSVKIYYYDKLSTSKHINLEIDETSPKLTYNEILDKIVEEEGSLNEVEWVFVQFLFDKAGA